MALIIILYTQRNRSKVSWEDNYTKVIIQYFKNKILSKFKSNWSKLEHGKKNKAIYIENKLFGSYSQKMENLSV